MLDLVVMSNNLNSSNVRVSRRWLATGLVLLLLLLLLLLLRGENIHPLVE
jgi:hypothetical protein